MIGTPSLWQAYGWTLSWCVESGQSLYLQILREGLRFHGTAGRPRGLRFHGTAGRPVAVFRHVQSNHPGLSWTVNTSVIPTVEVN